MSDIREQGHFLQADFFENEGGLNLSDSPFRVANEQCTDGRNWEYAVTGGIRKRDGHIKVNTSADSAVKQIGTSLFIASDGTKTVLRGGDRKIQNFNASTPSFTNLSEDTAGGATTNVLPSSSTLPVSWCMFTSNSNNVTWAADGMASLYGVYSSTKFTKNGADTPGGSVAASPAAGAGIPDGTYKVAITLVKASTLQESNAALDDEVILGGGNNQISVDLSSVTVDTTKYSKIKIYISALAGVVGFTAGTLAATQTPITLSTVTITSLGTAATVPRAGATTDYSVLPSGTYNTITSWKRRLVTASGSVLYFSASNTPEIWPTANYVTIPTAGAITALAAVSFNTTTGTGVDEFLCIFKEKELWMITGTDPSSATGITLIFVDSVGAVNQPVVVTANGFLAFMDYQGIYIWDGSGKPIYTSRPLEPLFATSGDITKSKLSYAWGVYYRKAREITWVISHGIHGEQKFAIKLDLRLTLPQVQTTLSGRILDGVFLTDVLSSSIYSGASVIISTTFEETIYSGDGAGFAYVMYSAGNSYDVTSTGIDFQYETKFMDFGSPSTSKRFSKVIAWCEDTTDANLTLDWWAGYRSESTTSGRLRLPASTLVGQSLWDLGYWDVANFDSTVKGYNPVVYNLQTGKGQGGGTEGECLKLKFSNSDAHAPITIAGFSVLFTNNGIRR